MAEAHQWYLEQFFDGKKLTADELADLQRNAEGLKGESLVAFFGERFIARIRWSLRTWMQNNPHLAERAIAEMPTVRDGYKYGELHGGLNGEADLDAPLQAAYILRTILLRNTSVGTHFRELMEPSSNGQASH